MKCGTPPLLTLCTYTIATLIEDTMVDNKRPNIVVIITDQERGHKHWPKGWAERNLREHYDRLIGCKNSPNRSSAVFTNAFTATTECSPSRASLLTSSYPTEHGVTTTPGVLDPVRDCGDSVKRNTGERSKRPNLLRLLSGKQQNGNAADARGHYNVSWKGKWHLCHSNDPSILNYYGTTSPWNPPDAGHSLCASYTLGGGRKYNHDGRFLRGTKRKFDVLLKQQSPGQERLYLSDSDESASLTEEGETESVFDFLLQQKLGRDDGKETQPFCLIASLVNPHDVWASSRFSGLTDEEFFRETGYHPRDFESIPIDLPLSRDDDLLKKPSIQSILSMHSVFGDLSDSTVENDQQRKSDALRYVRFYAYLHKLVDDEISSLLDKIEDTGQMDNTIIIRMADHGELALCHAMREKRMQCYEETMNIPLVINYPSNWFNSDVSDTDRPVSTNRSIPQLVSSIDILPTIADLAGIDCSQYHYRGTSLVPFLRNDSSLCASNEEILFTFDEPLAPRGIPGYIRCIRTHDIKYAVYFTGDGMKMEYEMYSLQEDPHEMNNLCPPNSIPNDRWYSWHERLTRLMKRKGAVPTDFDWESMSTPKEWHHLADLSKPYVIC